MKYIASLFLWLIILLSTTPRSYAQQVSATTLGDYSNVTVMEVTGNYDANNADGTVNAAPRQAIAKEFYRLHKDEYDFLVIFTNFDFLMPGVGTLQAKAFYTGVRNDTSGIGVAPFNNSALYGSNSKLQGTVDMGNLSSMASNPLDPAFEDTLATLSHELMHRWATRVKFKNADGSLNSSLLGMDNAHWSFLLGSQGSLMYGNTWQDNGDGTFTSTKSQGQLRYYSPLDLYLMGLYDRTQVPPVLLIENATVNDVPVDPAQLPQAGVTVAGTARYVTVDDIIAAEGNRTPNAATSQKTFKTAFIFATTPGTFQGDEVYAIENIRTASVTRFSVETDGIGIISIASTPTVTLPGNPGVVPPSITPRTAPPDANEGVAWLISRQQSDGHWEDLSLTAQRDTTETLLSLKNVAAAQQSCQNGLAWLSTAAAGNTDYTARAIFALVNAGRDASLLVNRLVSEQNADGGWGSKKNFISNAADTGMALRSLAAAAYGNTTVISNAITFLKGTQNPDGGWCAAPAQASGIQPTATVLSALNKHRGSYQVDAQINAGAAWLISKQSSTDNGFGNSPSTVYDTAVAVLVLRELSAPMAITNNGLAYLRNKQSGTGSWNESAYQTSLAVEALWSTDVAPDLSIVSSDISLEPAAVTSIPANVTINATVRNLGYSQAPQATVALYDGNPALGKKVGEQVASFPVQSAVTLTFSTTVIDGADHTYFVSIDPLNAIAETNRTNNIAWSTLSVNLPYPSVGFELATSSGNELTASAQIKVALSASYLQPVTVNYSVNPSGTANNGTNYTLSPGTLTFAPGETVKYINVTIIDDHIAGANKTIALDLANPLNAVLGQSSHTFTILDGNVAPVVTILSPGPLVVSTNAPQLLYSVAPTNATVIVSIDFKVVNKVSGDLLELLSNGTHKLRVVASDGFNSSYAEETFVVNYNPPTVTILSPISSAYTNTAPLLRYQTDNANTVTVKVDGTIVQKQNGDKLNALSDGEHIVRVEVVNASGASGHTDVAFIIDTKIQKPYDLTNTLSNLGGSYFTSGAAADSEGNTYVTFMGSGGDNNIYVRKYDRSGLILWDKSFTSPRVSVLLNLTGIAVDGKDSVYVTYDFGDVISSLYQNVEVAKMDKDGNLEWIREAMAGNASDYSYDVSIGKDGNVYVGGTSGCFYVFWDKYDTAGNLLQSSRSDIRVNYCDWSPVAVIAGDREGRAFVAGNTSGSLRVGSYQFPSAGGVDYFVAGSISNQGGTSGYDGVGGIAVDDLGGVYVTGTTSGSLDGNANQGGNDVFIAKYGLNGYRQWTYQLGTASADGGYAIKVESNGVIYVAGKTAGTLPGSTGSGGLFLLKGDGSGNQFNPYWVQQFGTDTGSAMRNLNVFAPGYVQIEEGSSSYTLRDPRLPNATIDPATLTTLSSGMTLSGTIDADADVVQVTTDTGATAGIATHPTPSTWQVGLNGLMDGANKVVVTIKNTSGFQDKLYGTIIGSIPLSIATATLASGIVDVPYSQTLIVTGGNSPYLWLVAAGALPQGLSLDNATGVISGAPTRAGMYSFTLEVVDAGSRIATMNMSMVIDALPMQTVKPNAPIGLEAVDASDVYSRVNLAWTDASNNESAFVLERKTGPAGTYSQIAVIPSDTALYLDVTVTSNTTYYYRVKAVNSAGDSPWSNEAAVTLLGKPLYITTIAGTGQPGSGGDGGPALMAQLSPRGGIAMDSSGNLYVVDQDFHVVRKLDSNGIISTVAGDGSIDTALTDGIPATSASLGYPTDVAVDNAGNIYIADMYFSRIMKVDTLGILTTVAGNNGQYAFSGDGGPATQAGLCMASGVAVDSVGNLYIADVCNNRIRKVDVNGIISTITGTGQAGFSGDGDLAAMAIISSPTDVVVDNSGNIYIADSGNAAVRKINNQGIITTVAGKGTYGVTAVTVDSTGNIYVADQPNNKIRKIDTNGIVTTAAGNGQYAFNGDGGPAPLASIAYPLGVAADAQGRIYVADSSNYRIRQLLDPNTVEPVSIATTTLPEGMTGTSYNQRMVSRGGMAPYTWSIAGGVLPAGLSLDSSQGVISGVPSLAGSSAFMVKVTAPGGTQDEKIFTVTINAPLTISTVSLPTGTNGISYDQNLSASGGRTPYTWSVVSGAFPTGLKLNAATGSITGIPTTSGTFGITVQVADANGSSSSVSYTLTIITPFMISTSTLTSGVTGSSYSQTLAATGGTTPYTWSIVTGSSSLPAGLTLKSTTGVISGTSTSAGTFTFTAQAKDAKNATTTKNLSISIYAPLSITTTALVSGMTGSAYAQTLAAIGGLQPYVWSTMTGTLPTGLSLNSEGMISGTPTTAGTSTVTYKVTDANSRTSAKSLGITIAAPLSITTTTLASGTTGTSYSQTLAATGGKTPYAWSISAGSLSSGLTLSAISGKITGTPISAGTSTFTVQVKDANNATSAKTLSIGVYSPLSITTTSLSSGLTGSAYSQILAATGGLQPYVWSMTTGTLPAGLALDGPAGVISGTPTSSGTATVTYKVTDANSKTSTKSLGITIIGPLSITTTTLVSGTTGTSYSQTLAATGGKTPYTWSKTAGNLPAGYSLSTAGVISGTTTSTGTYSFTAQVKDANNTTSTKSINISVYAPPSITTASLPAGTRSTAYSQTLAASGGVTPYTWSISSGNLPAGLILTSTTGVISGTPTTRRTYSFTVKVTDVNAKTATKALSIIIN